MKIAVVLLCLVAIDVTVASKANNYVKNYYKKLSQVQDSPICGECQTVFADFKSAISDSAKFKKMQNVLQNTCNLFSGDSFTECESIVGALGLYAGKIKQLLGNPEDICRQMQLCRGGTEAAAGNKAIVLALKALTQTTKQTSLTESENCDECVLVINTMYAILADSGVEKGIRSIATIICSAITNADTCQNLMNEYFDTYMMQVLKYLSDPVGVCTTFFVCRSSSNPKQPLTLKNFEADARYQRISTTLSKLPRLQTKSGASAGCTACTVTLTTIDAILNQKTILNKTASALGVEICDIFPSSLRPGCVDWMNYYLASIIYMTVNNWTPDQICTKFKACPGSSSSVHAMTMDQQSSIGCEACQDVSAFLTSELQNPAFQTDVLSLVKSISCAKSSSPDSKLKCESGVDVVGPYILADNCPIWLSNLCSFLHLCPAS